MAEYKCFSCGKPLLAQNIKRKVRCVYCGSKMVFKPRTISTTIVAR